MLAPTAHPVRHQIKGEILAGMVGQLHGAAPRLHRQQLLERYCKNTFYLARAIGNFADILNHAHKGMNNGPHMGN